MGDVGVRDRGRTRARPRVGWGWILMAMFSTGVALMLAVLTTGECYRGDCSVALAGGPVGWVAIGVLLLQAVWSVVRAFHPPPG